MVIKDSTNFVFNPTIFQYEHIIVPSEFRGDYVYISFTFTATTQSSDFSMTYSFNRSKPISISSGTSVIIDVKTNITEMRYLNIDVTSKYGYVSSYNFFFM